MPDVSYSEFREKLASVMDQVVENREVVHVTRHGHATVAVIAADELSSLLETVHLLRSPKNALRLLGALQDSYTGEGMQKVTFDELVQAAQKTEPIRPGGRRKSRA
jgi:antitoxin YefM